MAFHSTEMNTKMSMEMITEMITEMKMSMKNMKRKGFFQLQILKVLLLKVLTM